jgi:uncharacterized protein YcfJ
MNRTWLLLLIGVLLGALAGWLYWSQVGCASGTCAITSSPINSTLYGAFMGGLLANSFRSGDKATRSPDNNANQPPR